MDSANEPAAAIDLADLTAHIVGAYVSKNAQSTADLPRLIAEVHHALSRLGTPKEPGLELPIPAVPVKRSVQPEAITCLECGKKFKSLKRHLMTSHDLTPEGYRERWNLPHSYPMVAPAYSETRSHLAKAVGLGRKPGASPRKPRRP